MAIVYEGLVFAGVLILALHVLSRKYDHIDSERLTHVYYGLVMLISGMALGEGRDIPEWIFGVGAIFICVGIWYSALWKAEDELDEKEETV